MAKWDIKSIVIASFFAYIAITILNFLFHMVFPQIPIYQTGVALILILVGIALTMIFTYAEKGFSKDEIYALLTILAVMVAIYFVVKHFVPGLFSVFPSQLKDVFSFIP